MLQVLFRSLNITRLKILLITNEYIAVGRGGTQVGDFTRENLHYREGQPDYRLSLVFAFVLFLFP